MRQLLAAGFVLLLANGAHAQGIVPLDDYPERGMPLSAELLAKRCAALTSYLAGLSLAKSGAFSRQYAEWDGAAKHFRAKLTDDASTGLYITQLERIYQAEAQVAFKDQYTCSEAYRQGE